MTPHESYLFDPLPSDPRQAIEALFAPIERELDDILAELARLRRQMEG